MSKKDLTARWRPSTADLAALNAGLDSSMIFVPFPGASYAGRAVGAACAVKKGRKLLSFVAPLNGHSDRCSKATERTISKRDIAAM